MHGQCIMLNSVGQAPAASELNNGHRPSLLCGSSQFSATAECGRREVISTALCVAVHFSVKQPHPRVPGHAAPVVPLRQQGVFARISNKTNKVFKMKTEALG